MPQTAQGVFFSASARAAVAPVFRPFVNALPLPNGSLIDPACDNITNPCLGNLTASYSNPSTLNATSIRIDQSVAGKINRFARYNHAPSYDALRVFEELDYDTVNTDTLTFGATAPFTANKMNDFRANWSRNTGTTSTSLTNFMGGVAPPDSVLHPPGSPYGPGAHQLKFGVDYRRLSPISAGSTNYSAGLGPLFQTLVLGNVTNLGAADKDPFSVTINSYSLFAQDTWKATNKLTLTDRLRWGGQLSARVGHVRQALIRNLGNLRFEPDRGGAVGSLAHQI
jgi:hypothetical protein